MYIQNDIKTLNNYTTKLAEHTLYTTQKFEVRNNFISM